MAEPQLTMAAAQLGELAGAIGAARFASVQSFEERSR
jgi:hypothetical protein